MQYTTAYSISGLFSIAGLNLSGISLKKRLRHNEINGIYVHPNHKRSEQFIVRIFLQLNYVCPSLFRRYTM
ncbi:hypothetical protein EMIT0180MI3_20407 [Priestia megaterium]